MKEILLFMILVVSTLFAQDSCYKVDKKYFKTNLEPKVDLILDIGKMFTNPTVDEYNITRAYLKIEFDTPKYIPYLSEAVLDCIISEEDNNTFNCSGDCDGGHISVKKKDDGIYFRIGGARMSETTDDPVIYDFLGTSDSFIKAKEVGCFSSKDAIVKVDNFEEDKTKSRFIKYLSKLKDIVIYDIDYNDKVAIAVGEDNSVKTREQKSKDEFYSGISLYSFDKGKSWKRTDSVFDVPLKKVITLKDKKAVSIGAMDGSGGFIYITDDAGKNWKVLYKGIYLNDIAKVRDGYVAVGQGILKSKDGKKWKEIVKSDYAEFYNIVALDNQKLVVNTIDGIIYSHDSGKTWHQAKLSKEMASTLWNHLYIKDGKVFSQTDHPYGYKIFSSDLGKTWKEVDVKKDYQP